MKSKQRYSSKITFLQITDKPIQKTILKRLNDSEKFEIVSFSEPERNNLYSLQIDALNDGIKSLDFTDIEETTSRSGNL